MAKHNSDKTLINTTLLIDEFAEIVLETHGKHTQFDRISGYENCQATNLVFIQDAKHLPAQAAVIITTPEVAQEIKDQTQGFIVGVADPRLAQAHIGQRFDDYQSQDLEWERIHPSAVIHASSSLSDDCRIGPNVVIGANCTIKSAVIIRSNSVIEHGVTIGANSIINSCVNIGYASEIGQNVIIKSGAVIGGEGYGFAPDRDKSYHRIPHTGNVIIEDDVRVGANCCIDRGTYGATHIHRGVKIDNLCHIAHNCIIEENALLISMTGISGSNHIGKRAILSGQTGTLDHINIADDAVLVHRAGVSQDVKSGGVWAGTPPRPLKEYLRAQRLPKTVKSLENRIKELEKKLNS